MNTLEFLQHVLPDTGPYCICVDWKNTKGEKGYKQFPAADLDEAAAIAAQQDRHEENVFFAVGALITAREWAKDKQRWRTSRTGDNIRAVRSYILDLDAGVNETGKERQYETVEAALAALKAFIKGCKLPRPTITSSGNGLHVYWTMEDEVPEAEWEANGKRLKALAQAAGLLIDAGRTADSSSVLRVVGTRNYKYTPPQMVQVLLQGPRIPNAHFNNLLGAEPVLVPQVAAAPDVFGSNIEKYTGEPLDMRRLVENCQTFRYTIDPANQEQGSAAIPEPAWLGAIMLTVHAKSGRKAAHLISNGDPRYNRAHVDQKFDQLVAAGIGPITCTRFEEAYKGTANENCCDGCPSKGKVKSPAVIARHVPLAPPLVVKEMRGTSVVERTVPELPKPFVRTKNGIGIVTADSKTGVNETVVFCEYDMYPVRLRYDERTMLEEDVLWRIKLPQEDWIEVDVPHTASQQVRTVLAKRGVYIDEPFVPHMTRMMSSYMRKLQADIPREMAFAKLGWRKDNSFVVGDTLYKPDGNVEAHCISHALERATEGGMVVAGDYDTWRNGIRIYARPHMQAYRVYLYSSLASIFYHMTGQIATCVSATGASGAGKSTLMEVCASIWGDPSKLVIRGDKTLSTRAAAEVRADGMHHLPVWMDEITGRDAKDVAELIFNYSGGKGKIRSTAQGGLRNDTATWSNLLLVNANTDEYDRISSIYRDSTQHLMRLVQLEFVPVGSIQKDEGDTVRRMAHENFGHAGRIFAEYCAQNYKAIKARVLAAVVEADHRVGAKSEERFWTAWIASTRVAAEIAHMLGILPGFPISDDVEWMYQQVEVIRAATGSHTLEPGEIMAEFLDAQVPNTLTVGAKGSSNIDNVIHAPRGELNVRFEVDNGTAFVSRNAFREYCAERNVNFNRAIDAMDKLGFIRRYNVPKVLGADTTYSKGRVKCIELNLDLMGGRLAAVPTPAPTAATPIKAAGGKP